MHAGATFFRNKKTAVIISVHQFKRAHVAIKKPCRRDEIRKIVEIYPQYYFTLERYFNDLRCASAR